MCLSSNYQVFILISRMSLHSDLSSRLKCFKANFFNSFPPLVLRKKMLLLWKSCEGPNIPRREGRCVTMSRHRSVTQHSVMQMECLPGSSWPMTAQYWGHVICSDQWVASIPCHRVWAPVSQSIRPYLTPGPGPAGHTQHRRAVTKELFTQTTHDTDTK